MHWRRYATDQFLLLDEFHVAQRFGGQLNGLIEAVLASVGHVHPFEYFDLKTLDEHEREWNRRARRALTGSNMSD